ncbi:hypothetical protein [Devosia sp.]|uniref:hypothetical protein n=1 Tax=Devosia sp. TaxID=1871048 RepID=UPI003A9077E4
MLAPLFAVAQQAPIPLPRRADRMPDSVQQLGPGSDTAAPIELLDDGTNPAADAAEAIALPPVPVTLSARITEDGSSIPDGLVWRVFETRTDASGDLALAAKSTDATARISLVPGEYVVHVAYGRAQTSATISVGPDEENSRSLVLDAGAMRLAAAITGDIPIPINLVRFDIFSTDDETDRNIIAQNLGANDLVTLNAGTYHVVSYFGSVNAVVRADLRVEPGQMTDATLYHRAAQVSFRLVSEAGGEAIADIEWTVRTAGGETVFTTIGTFPTTVLAEGDYMVLAKRGETVYNREFQVQPGNAREIEVLTTVYE